MDDYIRFRVNHQDKQQAKELFSRMGLSLSQAFNVFLKQSLAEDGLPFKPHLVKEPNAKTLAAMKEVDSGKAKTFKSSKDFYKDLGI